MTGWFLLFGTKRAETREVAPTAKRHVAGAGGLGIPGTKWLARINSNLFREVKGTVPVICLVKRFGQQRHQTIGR